MAKRKKISVANVKLSEKEIGFKFQGIYKGQVLGAPFQVVDQKSGEIITKQIPSVIMENDDGTKTAYLADVGLITNLRDAQALEGMKLEIVKLGKQKIKKGEMNQYDIFALE